MRKKNKSFKFANYITEKKEFCKIVEEKWQADIGSLGMFNLVKKLKSLKHHLNNLNWSNRNLIKKVRVLKEELKSIQAKTNSDPYDKNLRKKGSSIMGSYLEAVKDEEKLLYQKCKIKWLSYELFTTKLSEEEASKMVKPISNAEIKKAMFSIDDNKAPGPDGYSARFLKKAWHIVGNDVCIAVKEFFSTGKILGELHTTIISLIPKINTPLVVTDFRPIACCNVVYKCISKVITERIKGCLDKLINKNQSAFIHGRLIQDNILLAQDLMQGYNRVGGPKRVAFKIDIQKAYDTVSWDFMENLLKGIRQGDPMSPCLFTMVMEFFTLVMARNVRKSANFNYHFGCKSLKITHICLADDLMVFCHGDTSSVKVIKDLIEEFGKCSGLLPNFNKSTIFFRSISEDDQYELLLILPFGKGKLPMKYLGVPLISKRLGIKDCKCLIDKIKAKINH
ncbi:RNA-directed DNA polymerase, eukaryota, reverse transcriptase zinc-binding domain protein [Tanacetum coccineum]